MIGGTRRTAFIAFAVNFAALIKVELHECAGGLFGDKIELGPETLALFDLLIIQDQFTQRCIVAIVAHRVVITSAQQTAFILRVIREVATAFGNEEAIGEDIREAAERGFILCAIISLAVVLNPNRRMV